MPKMRLMTWDAAGRPIWDAPDRVASRPKRTDEPTAVGLCEQVDDKTGSTQCWVEITERRGSDEGTIVRTVATADSTSTSNKREETERSDARFLGLSLITGMQRNGYSYE